MANKSPEKSMGWFDLLNFKRGDIVALHKTWVAFFMTFYVWFNMAPLMTTIVKYTTFTMQQLKLLAVCNVALTVPGRVLIGLISDRYGPRRTFSLIMIVLAIPTIVFAVSETYTSMLISRLLMSIVGTGFVVGIHMTSLWFKPRDIGLAEGVEAGLGNWGSSIAAITLPLIVLNLIGGENGWRYGMIASGLAMLMYGCYYWFGITDGPPDSPPPPARKVTAIEVSTYLDLINAMIWTIPISGILALLTWRIVGMGFLSGQIATIIYILIGCMVVYQLWDVYRTNMPILAKGVPEDDKYRFTQVACLNASYIICFGAELATVSMLPFFFQSTFNLTPQMAGLIGSIYAFTNFFARALGGYISDRSTSRKRTHVFYVFGIATMYMVMSFIDSSWSLTTAIIVVFACGLCVMGTEGTTYAIVPLIKRRITGNIAGYVGAYGTVGATTFLTIYTIVDNAIFFRVISITTYVVFLFCLFFLKEPEGAFDHEYMLSSVDRELAKKDSESVKVE